MSGSLRVASVGPGRGVARQIVDALIQRRPIWLNVRCVFDNFGDVMVGQAIEALFAGRKLLNCPPIEKLRTLERVVRLDRLFAGTTLGGGTLIFTPRAVGWLDKLQYASERTGALGTIGTGVVDPSFLREAQRTDCPAARLSAADLRDWVDCLRRFEHVSVRGVEDQRLLAEHGLDNVRVIGDPALLFARETQAARPATRSIGINFSSHSYFFGNSQDRVRREFGELVRRLIRDQWRVSLFPTMGEEFEVMESLRREIGSERVSVFGRYLEVEPYLDALEAQDLFVGTKLHTVIAACCVSTPCLMVGYQPKCLNFMRTMNLEDLYLRTDQVDSADLMARIGQLAESPEPVRAVQRQGCRHFRDETLRFRDLVLSTSQGRRRGSEVGDSAMLEASLR